MLTDMTTPEAIKHLEEFVLPSYCISAECCRTRAEKHEHVGEQQHAVTELARRERHLKAADALRVILRAVKGKPKSGATPESEQAIRIAKLFNRKLSTGWSASEIRTFKSLGEIASADLDLLEAYYAAQRTIGDEGVHRRDLCTFLNNFRGELDRATEWRSKAGKKPGRSGSSTADPEGWTEWLKVRDLPYSPYRVAMEFMKGEFERRNK